MIGKNALSFAFRANSLSRNPVAGRRFATQWLQGRPPVVDKAAGTMASFYYNHIREAQIPSKDHIVSDDQDVKFSVKQWDRQVYAYAVGMLESLGLKKGSTIATWMANELESVVVRYAAGLLGINVVSIDPALDWDDVKEIIVNEDVRTLILSPRHGNVSRFDEVAEQFAEELKPVTKYAGYEPFNSKRFRSLKQIVCTSMEFEDGIMRFRDLPIFGNDGEYEEDVIAAVQSYVNKSEPIFTFYTGTPGKAVKGKTYNHADILESAQKTASQLKSTDAVLVTAPAGEDFAFTHGALAAAAAGSKLVYGGKNFDVDELVETAERQRVSVLVATEEQAKAISTAIAKDAETASAFSNLRLGLLPAGSANVSVGKITSKAV